MTSRIKALLALFLVLAACGGNPFLEPDDDGEDPGSVTDLPGTENPSASTAITRYEATDESNGNGFAQGFVYDAATDTYTIDNLGFDGANGYTRGTRVASLGSYNVYEASATEIDPQTGTPISQFQHRLLAGVSTSGRTEFAIVRTGAYRGYGFGGFVMKRNDAVTLPTDQQAAYSGDYAAVRDFDGRGGLQYATGDMEIAIDFRDFNAGDAVQGEVYNRQIFDVNGNNITPSVIAALNAEFDPDNEAPMTELPTLVFNVGPGVIDVNGELKGLLDSVVVDRSGTDNVVTEYEKGNYYGIVSGANADEIVGVIVVESTDPGNSSVTVRETGGFILYRP